MRIGTTITKSTAFRGVQQEFHNTYYHELSTAITAPSEGIIDELVATEKKLHSTAVNFVRAQQWTAGGTKAQNSMIFSKQLTGTGSMSPSTDMDRERAILVRWPAGFDSRGKPVYLRKWYHAVGFTASIALSVGGVLANTSELSTSTRDAIKTIAEEVGLVGAGETWSLVSKVGRVAQAAAQCHRFLEHHQLGDQWR